jgi:antitoxin (DNA-binding transcriptional repressor) of toxin-antitoxin stability system
MTKEITVADLREHLDERLQEVRNGTTLRVVTDDQSAVEIRPAIPHWEWVEINGLSVRPAKGSMRDVKFPPPLEPPIDVVALLREDRDKR